MCLTAPPASSTGLHVALHGSFYALWCVGLVFDAGVDCAGQVVLSAWFSLGYLVDPASSHMLVSKIKPCMSKYKRLYCETANGSLNQLWFI